MMTGNRSRRIVGRLAPGYRAGLAEESLQRERGRDLRWRALAAINSRGVEAVISRSLLGMNRAPGPLSRGDDISPYHDGLE